MVSPAPSCLAGRDPSQHTFPLYPSEQQPGATAHTQLRNLPFLPPQAPHQGFQLGKRVGQAATDRVPPHLIAVAGNLVVVVFVVADACSLKQPAQQKHRAKVRQFMAKIMWLVGLVNAQAS